MKNQMRVNIDTEDVLSPAAPAVQLTAERARAILSAAEGAWHDRDADALAAAVHPDVRIRFNDLPEIRGREDARAWIIHRMAVQKGYRLGKTLRGIDGNLIIGSWTGQWTDAETGEHWRGRGIELLALEDGLIREWDGVLHARAEAKS